MLRQRAVAGDEVDRPDVVASIERLDQEIIEIAAQRRRLAARLRRGFGDEAAAAPPPHPDHEVEEARLELAATHGVPASVVTGLFDLLDRDGGRDDGAR
jgi:hypothetical protein